MSYVADSIAIGFLSVRKKIGEVINIQKHTFN